MADAVPVMESVACKAGRKRFLQGSAVAMTTGHTPSSGRRRILGTRTSSPPESFFHNYQMLARSPRLHLRHGITKKICGSNIQPSASDVPKRHPFPLFDTPRVFVSVLTNPPIMDSSPLTPVTSPFPRHPHLHTKAKLRDRNHLFTIILSTAGKVAISSPPRAQLRHVNNSAVVPLLDNLLEERTTKNRKNEAPTYLSKFFRPVSLMAVEGKFIEALILPDLVPFLPPVCFIIGACKGAGVSAALLSVVRHLLSTFASMSISMVEYSFWQTRRQRTIRH